MLALPSQQRGLRARYGLTREQTDRFIWLVEVDTGRKWPGPAAISRVLKALGGAWAWLGRLYALPGMPWLQGQVYHWVAAHRTWFSRLYGTTPGCEQVDCEDDN